MTKYNWDFSSILELTMIIFIPCLFFFMISYEAFNGFKSIPEFDELTIKSGILVKTDKCKHVYENPGTPYQFLHNNLLLFIRVDFNRQSPPTAYSS